MARKKIVESAARQQQDLPRELKTGPASALVRARHSLDAGNVRRARAEAAESLRSGPDADKAPAQALLARLAPDQGALLAAAAVLLVVLFAAWAAILRLR